MKTIKIIAVMLLAIVSFGCAMKAGVTESETYRFAVENIDLYRDIGNREEKARGAYESFIKDNAVFLRGSAHVFYANSNVPEGVDLYHYKSTRGYVLYAAYDAVTDYVYILRADIKIIRKDLASKYREPLPAQIYTSQELYRDYISSHHGKYLEDKYGKKILGYPCPVGGSYMSDTDCRCCSLSKQGNFYVELEGKHYRAEILDDRYREGDYGNWWGYSVYITIADKAMKDTFNKLKNREKVSPEEIARLYHVSDTSITSTIFDKLVAKGGLLMGIPVGDAKKGVYEKIKELINHFRDKRGKK